MSASDITITESSITVPLWNFPDPSWTPAAREAFVASLTPGTVATPYYPERDGYGASVTTHDHERLKLPPGLIVSFYEGGFNYHLKLDVPEIRLRIIDGQPIMADRKNGIYIDLKQKRYMKEDYHSTRGWTQEAVTEVLRTLMKYSPSQLSQFATQVRAVEF